MLDTEAGAGRSRTSVVRALAGCDVCVTYLRAGCVIGICLEMFREALMEHVTPRCAIRKPIYVTVHLCSLDITDNQGVRDLTLFLIICFPPSSYTRASPLHSSKQTERVAHRK